MNAPAFEVAFSPWRAQYVVRWGRAVIVPTRAHASACRACGLHESEHASADNDHAFKRDDARKRAPELAEALNRVYA